MPFSHVSTAASLVNVMPAESPIFYFPPLDVRGSRGNVVALTINHCGIAPVGWVKRSATHRFTSGRSGGFRFTAPTLRNEDVISLS